MKGTLFAVVFVKNPTQKEIEETGASSTVLAGPIYVIANDASSAGVIASRSLDAGITIDATVETLARPF